MPHAIYSVTPPQLRERWPARG